MSNPDSIIKSISSVLEKIITVYHKKLKQLAKTRIIKDMNNVKGESLGHEA